MNTSYLGLYSPLYLFNSWSLPGTGGAASVPQPRNSLKVVAWGNFRAYLNYSYPMWITVIFYSMSSILKIVVLQ